MTATLRFLHDGETVSLSEVDPTRTVLQYLREDVVRTGSKEGCAEGDCGACMVVVAELDASGSALRYRAINSCIQFLATLDGKALITVESLSPPGGPLHPVQQAMVDCHGSQCGFCTPGFVMTLFAMYCHREGGSRAEINDALAGNLCRCTGYRPIVEAAERMYDYPLEEQVALAGRDERETIAALKSLKRNTALQTGQGGRQFLAPANLTELIQMRTAHPDATLLAGGTDVGLWVTKQFRDLDTVISLGGVRELARIDVTETEIEMGATVTFTDALPVLTAHYPDLKPLLRRFASPPIRNAATVGGNIANGSPIGDSMPALIAIGARVVIASTAGERELALEDLYHDYMVNDLKPGEFVARIRLPLPRPDQIVRCYKISKRFDQDISAVCAAFSMDYRDGVCHEVRTGFGGVAAIPKRAAGCEGVLQGQPLDDATLQLAMTALDEDFTPMSDMRASADYRRQACRNLLRRYFLAVTQPDVATEVYDFGR